MINFKADLHCHSTCSDGSDSPITLIKLAMEKGLTGLSITDHDTIAAYEEALPYAQKQGFPLLPGVEFSSFYRNEAVHILGYAFPLKSPTILALCERHEKRRKTRNSQIIQNLKELGIDIKEDEIFVSESIKTIGRPHIAQALMKRGVVDSIKDAFDRYLGEGKPAYTHGDTISIEETLDAIHQAGGRAVIAHPHLIKRRSVIRTLLNFPFDGLEGYYARLPKDQEKEWIERAQKKGWIITGGSDYHGEIKPYSTLGSSWVNQETFEALYAHYLQSEEAFKLRG